MVRVTGPSRAELDARGDLFAARVTRAIRTTLRDVAATTKVVDDLARIQTVWRSVVTYSLAPHLRKQWDVAVLGVKMQLEKISASERETLLAAVFEIPKVSNPLAESFLAAATNRLVAIGDVVWYTARGEMLTGLQLGEGVAELRERVVESAKVSQKRAEVIARTEVNSAMNNGAYQQMKATGFTTIKEWIATNDSRTRESHEEVDGEEIAGDAKFMVGGFPMDHPHDLTAPPGETINCRCALAWEIVDDDEEDDYLTELLAAGDFDETEHPRDNKGKFAKKAGTGFKVGKKLKITKAWTYKNHKPGTVAITDDGRSKVEYTGHGGMHGGKALGPYVHYHRLSTNDEWVQGKKFSKAKAFEFFENSIADGFNWHEPASDSDNGNVDVPETNASPKPASPGKSVGKGGAPLKITHLLVHKSHGQPGDILAENGAGDKRVIWDGQEYRLQHKTNDGNWTTDKSVKKSKAYVEINAYDSDWREPTGSDVTTDADVSDEIPDDFFDTPIEDESKSSGPKFPKKSKTKSVKVASPTSSTDSTSVPVPNTATPGAVISQAVPTDGYVKTGPNQYKDPDGNEWILTPYNNSNIAKNEVFAAQLYSLFGLATPQTELAKLDEKNFPKLAKRIGTRKFAVQGVSDPSKIASTVEFDAQLRKQLWDGFAVDLWLGNKNTAAFENLTIDKNNNLVRDSRSTFGGSDTFADTITLNDINEMRSPYQGNAGSILNPKDKPAAYVNMPNKHLIDGARKIANLSPEQIDKLVDGMGFGPITASTYKAKLKSRRQSLIKVLEKDFGVEITDHPEVIPESVPQVGPGGGNGQPNFPTVTKSAGNSAQTSKLNSVEPSGDLGLLNMDGLTKVKPLKNGAIFKNASGTEWFVKPVPSASHMSNQQLAANLYLFAGVKAETPLFVELDKDKLKTSIDTNIAVQTEYNPGTQSLVDAVKSNPAARKEIFDNFAVDAWLGNWDVVGIGYDNITVDKHGKVQRTNLGGSLLYRANGQPKGAAFGDTVTEIDTLRNPHKNPSSAKVFADITDDDIRAGVAKIEKITPETIDFIVDQSGVTGNDAKLLKQKLKARRQDLINKYGSNAPKLTSTNAPAASTQPTATNVFGGTKVYTATQKAKVQSIFAKHGLKWHNKTDAIYDAAHEVSTTHPDLTMADALDIMDQSLKKKTGNPFRTKVESWLKTKAGKQHALAKGGSASLGSTAPKVSATPSPGVTPTSEGEFSGKPLPRKLTRQTAGILQKRMNEATPPPWTNEQRSALKSYTGSTYVTINKCARATAPCDPTTKKQLNAIQEAMKPSTDNVVLYRKTNAVSFGLTSPEEVNNLVGKTISDNGVVSTSIKSNLWSGQLHLEIEAPKGTMMAWVQPISHHPNEDEMVLAPGTHYEVVSVTDSPYGIQVKLRVIPGSDTRSRNEKEKLAIKEQIAALQKAKVSA